jgi:hypothetical protein
MMRTTTTVLVATALLAMTGCPPTSMGEITNEISDDLSFVDDDQVIFYSPGVNSQGAVRINIDGTDQVEYVPDTVRIRDVTADGALWVLGDSNNQLYTIQSPGEEPRRVEFFDGRVSSTSISPDHQTIAVTLHADYSLPQEQQANSVDDTVYLVDADTHEVEIIDNWTDKWVHSIFWLDDGRSLYLELENQENYILDLDTAERTQVDGRPDEINDRIPPSPTTCEAMGAELTSGDAGIELYYPDEGRTEELVGIEGRERGFHDYFATIDQLFFTQSCNSVVFVYDRAIWVVDVESKIVGHLADGRSAFLLREY